MPRHDPFGKWWSSDQRGGRSHLAAGHAVNSIVDENGADVLAAVCSMDDLSSTDGSEVAVALVGEYEGILADNALCAGCNCGCAAVCGFVHIAVKVIICKYGAADRCYADDLTLLR